MALTYYDIAKFCPDRIEQKLVICGEKATPELNLLPPKLRPGCAYDTPVLKSMGSTDIWAKIGEGACDLKVDFDMVTTKAYGFDVKSNIPKRLRDCSDASNQIGGMTRGDWQRVAHVANIRHQMVDQLYKGQKFGNPNGSLGFPDITCYTLDALSKELNCTKDFHGDLTPEQSECLTDIYIGKPAASSEADGLAIFWGNNETLNFSEEVLMEVPDAEKSAKTGQDCTYQAYCSHITGAAGLQAYCNQDVMRITNVPTFKLDGFELDRVLAQVYSLFTDLWKPEFVLMHNLAYNAWWMSRQNDSSKNCCIQTLSDDGSFGGRFSTWNPFGIPIVTTDCAPIHALETLESQSIKDSYEQVRDEAGVPTQG